MKNQTNSKIYIDSTFRNILIDILYIRDNRLIRIIYTLTFIMYKCN